MDLLKNLEINFVKVFKKKLNMIKTKAIAKHKLNESFNVAFPAVRYRWRVKGLPLANIWPKKLEGILLAVPTVNKKIADSPIILPAARIIALTIPNMALGRIKLKTTWNFSAPSAKAPYLYDEGTARIASLEVSIILGRIQMLIVKQPTKIEGVRPSLMQKMLYPKRPIKSVGVLDKILIKKLINFKIFLDLEYSVI